MQTQRPLQKATLIVPSMPEIATFISAHTFTARAKKVVDMPVGSVGQAAR